MSVKEMRTTTAEEFLAVLSPTGATFGKGEPDQFIFRGHALGEWPLVPSALREHLLESNAAQIGSEARALRDFLGYADRQGLRIPSDSRSLRQLLSEAADRPAVFLTPMMPDARDPVWPRREMFDLVALAQHSRLKTRMLDWTRSPLIAAYFAVAAQVPRGAGVLAVWGCDTRGLTRIAVPGSMKSFEFVTVPFADNVNALVQQGLFTLEVHRMMVATGPVEAEPLEAVIADVSDVPGPLTKVTLPHSEAGRALRLLARHGITAATMFPGYRGAADAVLEKYLWRA